MLPIVLSGFMATGKSTVGPRLAARLDLPFVDTDAAIVQGAGKSVAEIFRDEGEAGFRAREKELVEQLLASPEARVLALGGGTVTSRRLRHYALDRALVVTLSASPETVLERVAQTGGRPLLAGADPRARACELLEARADAYAECHLSLVTDNTEPDALVDAIVALAERSPVAVPLGTRSYVVDFTRGKPTHLTDALARLGPSSLVVVDDANVERARGGALMAALGPLAVRSIRVTLPAGEQHKNLASVGTIWDAALGAGIDRDGVVVAFGGGVVGDLAGFASACLLRGVRVVQVPTTLLAMVDASVGGKTGFDHASGKNLVGAFHQPSAVVIDLEHLSTLSVRERTAGLAEVVKAGLALDATLFEALRSQVVAVRAGDPEVLLPIVRAAVKAKARVVRDDEREGQPAGRVLLNVGHTVGHALEAHGGYTRYLHGEAVAIGTVLELAVGASLGITPPDLVVLARELFQSLGFAVTVSRDELAAAWRFALADKKRAGARLKFPVVTSLGAARVEMVAFDVLERALLGEGVGRFLAAARSGS
ncbi:MAG: bifunctional shikimate kinase/3-dehydroquinate synthase [Myxococcales bacterium]